MTEPSILVADDGRIVSLDIQSAYSRLGYRVAGTAATGAESLALVSLISPDLVLTDIRLAENTDGTEATISFSRRRDDSVAFLTAYSDGESKRRALLARGPVDAAVFTSALESPSAADLAWMLRDRRAGAVAGILSRESGPQRRRLDAGMDDALAQTAGCRACVERLAELLSRRSFLDSRTTDRQGADAP